MPPFLGRELECLEGRRPEAPAGSAASAQGWAEGPWRQDPRGQPLQPDRNQDVVH